MSTEASVRSRQVAMCVAGASVALTLGLPALRNALGQEAARGPWVFCAEVLLGMFIRLLLLWVTAETWRRSEVGEDPLKPTAVVASVIVGLVACGVVARGDGHATWQQTIGPFFGTIIVALFGSAILGGAPFYVIYGICFGVLWCAVCLARLVAALLHDAWAGRGILGVCEIVAVPVLTLAVVTALAADNRTPWLARSIAASALIAVTAGQRRVASRAASRKPETTTAALDAPEAMGALLRDRCIRSRVWNAMALALSLTLLIVLARRIPSRLYLTVCLQGDLEARRIRSAEGFR